MHRVLFSLIALLLLAAPAHAQKTKAQMTTEVNTNLPDNTIGSITPAILRTTFIDLINSYLDLNGASTFTCAASTWVSSGTTAGFTCTGLPSGVDANVLNTQTGNYPVALTDCGKTIQLGTGATGFFTLTFPSVAGFATTCSVRVVNSDTASGKAISGLTGITKLYPGQAFTAKIVNGAWVLFDKPPRYLVANGVTLNLYANNSATGCAGSVPCLDTNDGLSPGTATATFTQMMTDAATNLDNEGTISYNIAANTTWTNSPFLIQQTVGTGSNALVGNNAASPNVTLTCNVDCGSATNNCLICFEGIRAKWQVIGFAFSTTAAVTATSHLFVQGSGLTLQFGNLSFGTLTTTGGNSAAHISCQYSSSVDNIGNYKITAGLAGAGSGYHFNFSNSCVGHVRSSTVTLTGTPPFTVFANAHNVGILGLLSGTFTGAATGIRCASDGGSVIDTGGSFNSLPGNSNCVVASATSGGTVN